MKIASAQPVVRDLRSLYPDPSLVCWVDSFGLHIWNPKQLCGRFRTGNGTIMKLDDHPFNTNLYMNGCFDVVGVVPLNTRSYTPQSHARTLNAKTGGDWIVANVPGWFDATATQLVEFIRLIRVE